LRRAPGIDSAAEQLCSRRGTSSMSPVKAKRFPPPARTGRIGHYSAIVPRRAPSRLPLAETGPPNFSYAQWGLQGGHWCRVPVCHPFLSRRPLRAIVSWDTAHGNFRVKSHRGCSCVAVGRIQVRNADELASVIDTEFGSPMHAASSDMGENASRNC